MSRRLQQRVVDIEPMPAEGQVEPRRVLPGERHIAAADRPQPALRIVDPGPCLPHERREGFETQGSHRRQQAGHVAEMVGGRGMGDSCAPGAFPQGEALDASFRQHDLRGREERGAQIAVVIAAATGCRPFRARRILSARILFHHRARPDPPHIIARSLDNVKISIILILTLSSRSRAWISMNCSRRRGFSPSAAGLRWPWRRCDRARRRSLAAWIVPSVLGLIYAALIVRYWREAEGGFGSLSEVGTLFSHPGLLLAGWLHYLAFDLLVGAWEVREARRIGLPHGAVLPALLLTFLFGPIGFLAFLALRGLWLGKLFSGRRGGIA